VIISTHRRVAIKLRTFMSSSTDRAGFAIGDPGRCFIAGQWRPGSGGEVLVDRNPYDGSTIGEFPVADVDDIDAAYRSAADAQRTWAQVNPYAKRAVFERAVAYVEERSDEITTMIIAELGGTRLKAAFEIGLVIDMLKEAATLPLRMEGRILPSPIDEKENRLYREPVGVVGVISPFNFPFFLGIKSVAPAIAAGNGVVLKPHEHTPIVGGTLIGEIFEAAGVPKGLLNVVVTEIAVIGDAFVEHPVPRVISFTGSAAVGRHVAEVSVRNFKKPILELGGNSALIVLADADLDLAVDAAVFSRFTHQGQICMSANRVLVHQDLYEEFLDRFVTKVKSLPVGDPSAPETIIGPLISQKQADSLDAQVERGISRGARPALRGPVHGTLFAPVVLVDVTPDNPVMQEELFGPVVCVVPFADDDEAVELANNTPFGLSGAVHTRDIGYGVEFARRIETGMIHINDTTIHDEPIVAFGGEKSSGSGRLNGEWSLNEFTTLKWISIHHGRRKFPY
jgi:vanillin dehydrogenase